MSEKVAQVVTCATMAAPPDAPSVTAENVHVDEVHWLRAENARLRAERQAQSTAPREVYDAGDVDRLVARALETALAEDSGSVG